MLQKPGPILTVLGCMFRTMPPRKRSPIRSLSFFRCVKCSDLGVWVALTSQSPDAPVRWVNRSSLWATQVGGTGQ